MISYLTFVGNNSAVYTQIIAKLVDMKKFPNIAQVTIGQSFV